jgi:hypothetical protein
VYVNAVELWFNWLDVRKLQAPSGIRGGRNEEKEAQANEPYLCARSLHMRDGVTPEPTDSSSTLPAAVDARAGRLWSFRCTGCGYGAQRRMAPERCPMCGGCAWDMDAWRPFTGKRNTETPAFETNIVGPGEQLPSVSAD